MGDPPGTADLAVTANKETRDIVFISKATPEDDEFVLWLAPRLEAAGYAVFADILALEPGDRWRRAVTDTLQNKAAKMLLCCRDSTLNKNGVQEEIGIAEDLVKELKDSRFIIPLRLERFRKVFGIGELQWVDFIGSWASGLHDLLDTLKKQSVTGPEHAAVINPNWENYRKRSAIEVEQAPEVLTSTWLRVASIPDAIRYYYPPGAINHERMQAACRKSELPAEPYQRGFFSFASPEEVEHHFADIAMFDIHSEHRLLEFLENGSRSPDIKSRQAQNLVVSLFRRAWENFCRSKGLYEYSFATQTGFHVTEALVPLGRRIFWGRQGQRRLSMLCNSAGGKIWQYGVSASPFLWPFQHFKLKARVLFADQIGNRAGAVIGDPNIQHRLRRRVCKGWRNRAWHGRLMAFLELLSDGSPYIPVPLCGRSAVTLDARPMLFTSPVTTALPDSMEDDAIESDDSTLGVLNLEDDE